MFLIILLQIFENSRAYGGASLRGDALKCSPETKSLRRLLHMCYLWFSFCSIITICESNKVLWLKNLEIVHERNFCRRIMFDSQSYCSRKYNACASNCMELYQYIAQWQWRTQEKISGVQGYGRPCRGYGGRTPRTQEKFWKFAK